MSLRGRCVSAHENLRGKTALVKVTKDGYRVQFDDLNLGVWAYNWHWFAKHEFELLPSVFDTNPCAMILHGVDVSNGVLVECKYQSWSADGKEYLIKGEEDGAAPMFDQMKKAAEVRATTDALKKAGYTEKADGTFEGKFFKATITEALAEGFDPPQRVVEYVKKAKF